MSDFKRQPIYHNNRVVGILDGDCYRQQYDSGHIYRKLNAKGMNRGVYLTLQGLGCKWWLIQHKQTKQCLRMPFCKIKLVAVEKDMGKDGIQLLVPLEDFNVDVVAKQKTMI